MVLGGATTRLLSFNSMDAIWVSIVYKILFFKYVNRTKKGENNLNGSQEKKMGKKNSAEICIREHLVQTG